MAEMTLVRQMMISSLPIEKGHETISPLLAAYYLGLFTLQREVDAKAKRKTDLLWNKPKSNELLTLGR